MSSSGKAPAEDTDSTTIDSPAVLQKYKDAGEIADRVSLALLNLPSHRRLRPTHIIFFFLNASPLNVMNDFHDID